MFPHLIRNALVCQQLILVPQGRCLADRRAITVSCAGGEVGEVYDGLVAFDRQTIDLAEMPRPRTKVMVNVGNPDRAFGIAALPNDGVGPARMEFIISSAVRVDPMALVHFDQLADGPAKDEIAALTRNHKNRSDYFVDRLAEGVGRLAAAFYQKDVIVPLSDFKSLAPLEG